jgi:hypothetical protein
MTTDEYMQEMGRIFRNEPDDKKMRETLSCNRTYTAERVADALRQERITHGRDIARRAGMDPDTLDEGLLYDISIHMESAVRKAGTGLEKKALESAMNERKDMDELLSRAKKYTGTTMDTSGMSGYALQWEQSGNIGEVKRALDQGRMHIFPCRPGDTVWEVRGLSGGIIPHTVEDITVSGFPRQSVRILCRDAGEKKPYILTLKDFDRTVFTSHEAAKECYRVLQYEESMRMSKLPDTAMQAER